MTKEELEKEAGEWLCNNLHSASEEDFIKAMVDIAEPREKQIQIDAEQILALQKQNGELTDKVTELEAEVKEWKDKADLWCKTANLKDHNIMINKELEKENAELKDYRLNTMVKEQTEMSKYALNLENKLGWYDTQLTKAKKLLKRWLQTSKASGCDNINIVTDTEQFLKE